MSNYCACVEAINYKCSECVTKKRARRLSAIDQSKLLRYEKHITCEVNDDEELRELINYMASNDLDSSLIKYIN